ncbi:hypothetical protein EMIHUDRAFT_356170 [Emiliania huxleyi CCMP1516]|uniref:Uncharacterized protein n=2 Tax=Emiliania huxleyi TaxID=2903 RepID=A0A0D3IYP8_EMIH1|nr:hypothetical protein EMIHUDRAFT_356170 [Emiliania huxleyi CCMP1516]EOD16383.1 hypothetical protein EMIHUDRAFT_356170 [Emiliania huxleyi CCMP1516]|eukprot:XP_005768812.1 hypothetical protein EMIHUDRAFT_356170 [Emiliania huxleyi CCMP1516]
MGWARPLPARPRLRAMQPAATKTPTRSSPIATPIAATTVPRALSEPGDAASTPVPGGGEGEAEGGGGKGEAESGSGDGGGADDGGEGPGAPAPPPPHAQHAWLAAIPPPLKSEPQSNGTSPSVT